MSTLRDFLFGYEEAKAIPAELAVYNTSTTSPSNGGRCCLWTIPAGVSYATFEIWGGGAAGDGGCCCQMGYPSTGGSYGQKASEVSPGDQLTICAAGSTCCRQKGNCQQGCDSYVCKSGNWCARACGGRVMRTECFMYRTCYSCCRMRYCVHGHSGMDFGIGSTNSTSQLSQYCHDRGNMMVADNYGRGGFRNGPNGCCAWGGSQGFGLFPGGGGMSAQAYGEGCCCGSPGAGGLVYVVYY
tara:strand:- start:11135 stop:11857 length:723 start_codon:yes stop_codon:yes gene_type:complete